MNKLLKIRLNLFDGAAGGAAGSGSGAAPGAQGASAEQGGQNSPASTQQDPGDLSKVVYGKQPQTEVSNSPDAGDIKTTSNTLDEKRKAFQDLINGEYKDLYTEATQGIINKRFKETKTLQEALDKQQGLIDTLAARYGVSDVDSITKAVNDDTAFWAEAAEAKGMTVEQYKELNRLQRENAALLQKQNQQAVDAKVRAQMDQWSQEEQQMQSKYPNFSLSAEMENPEFLNLLKARIPMEHAYRLLHMDELMNNAVATAAADTEKAVVSTIRARGNRPVENGTSAQSAFQVKADPSKWSKADRREVAKRVGRGETITL